MAYLPISSLLTVHMKVKVQLLYNLTTKSLQKNHVRRYWKNCKILKVQIILFIILQSPINYLWLEFVGCFEFLELCYVGYLSCFNFYVVLMIFAVESFQFVVRLLYRTYSTGGSRMDLWGTVQPSTGRWDWKERRKNEKEKRKSYRFQFFSENSVSLFIHLFHHPSSSYR